MPEQFYVIPTAYGLAKIAQAIANDTEVALSQMAVGDSNGVYYEPTEGQTTLVHEVYRASLNSVTVDLLHANWIIAQMVILASVGGWDIREAGVYDTDGGLVAVGKYPLEHKPDPSEGAGVELTVQLIFVVASAAAITLLIDPSVVLATRAYVDAEIDRVEVELRKFAWFHGV